MGILNLTPDSFSDGGQWKNAAAAVDAALQMERYGCSVVDVGGESTRPGSHAVSAEEQTGRVLPVIERLRSRSRIVISVDTSDADVARRALDAGADMINDVRALRNQRLAELAAERNCPVVLMHMRGEPRTMQESIEFSDVMREIATELEQSIRDAERCGVARERIFVDPGIGFGKTADHNLSILRHASELTRLAPVVIGASRKAFIGSLTGRSAGRDRAAGSLAAVAAAARARAAMVRVHDVRETCDFLRVWSAIEGAA